MSRLDVKRLVRLRQRVAELEDIEAIAALLVDVVMRSGKSITIDGPPEDVATIRQIVCELSGRIVAEERRSACSR